MKILCGEGVANRTAPELCAATREGRSEALTGDSEVACHGCRRKTLTARHDHELERRRLGVVKGGRPFWVSTLSDETGRPRSDASLAQGSATETGPRASRAPKWKLE